MSPEQEGPPELQRLRQLLEAVNETASHLEVTKKAVSNPGEEREVKDLDEIRRTTEEALAEFTSFERGENAATRIVNALKRSTTTLVTAMNANAEVLGGALSDDNGTAFPADEAVLSEGVFLKEQLTGVVGTEGRGPLFKDAPIAVDASGFEVLSDAVSDANPPSYYSAGTP